jgi:UDP-glucose 4-epimerase
MQQPSQRQDRLGKVSPNPSRYPTSNHGDWIRYPMIGRLFDRHRRDAASLTALQVHTRNSLRFLITGGAGFIGSHLAERLLDRGDHVVLLDNLSTGSMENIRHLKSSDRMAYHLDSIENRQLVAELVDEADVILHLAAAVGVKLIVESPVHTIETNVNGTQMILEAASKKRKLVLAASTSEVYGKSTNFPFREDADLVLGPTTMGRWSYAASKALDEFLALSYWKEKKLPVIVVRLFNTVGPRQTGRYGMVLPNFVKAALDNTPIQVYGDGQQSRCFCDVRDTVEALVRLIDTERSVGEVVNVGGAEEISIEALAKLVKTRTGSESAIEFVSYDKAYEPGFEDMMRRVPCVDKLYALTGFRPETPLTQIIDRVTSFFQARNEHATPRAATGSSA